ncbi:hypothetical protein AQUCO_00100811v1 [Aquilegia coerulea]|uniref:MAPK kinase substrate protein n=1 Tax=Aquilegia coerulea TaxID=218851 RepID=A0A2G5FC22_AQUCA|nr:hypothetical protein AQUCO_00100811v1 [Aquilegia coerulea]
MAGLQRSEISFRRQGSSGLVWEDRFGELKKKEEEEGNEEGDSEFRELRPSKSVGHMERSRSNGGRGYRTGKVTPSLDPPSPKVSGCGFCGVFGKPVGDHRSKTKASKTDLSHQGSFRSK